MHNRWKRSRERPQATLPSGSIIVIIDVGSVPVGRLVAGADGGVLIVVMLPALVVGASVVHPVREVRLQPLGRRGGGREQSSQTPEFTTNKHGSFIALGGEISESGRACRGKVATVTLPFLTEAHF